MTHVLWSDQPVTPGGEPHIEENPVLGDQAWTDQPPTLAPDADAGPHRGAAVWERAVYPVGNGRLGGTVFGEPAAERIAFNHDALWVGNEDNTGAYQPFGDLRVELPHDRFMGYRRALDLETAVHTVDYLSGGVAYRRECFVSRLAQVLVLRLTADRPAALTGRVALFNPHGAAVTATGQTLTLRGNTAGFWYWQMQLEERDRLIANRAYASDQIIDLDFEARLRVLHDGGKVEAAGEALVFSGCDRVTMLLAADTNYLADRSQGWRGEHPQARVCAWLDRAAERGFDALRAEHLADYRSFGERVTLELASTPGEVAAPPTGDRAAAYAERVNSGLPPVDHDLEALLYRYARYLMLGSSAPDPDARTLPANLQGVWLISKKPPWRCDYHTDINLQMNYWFVDGSNLAECFEPLARWVDSIREVRKEETRRVLGVERGWLMRSENGVFGGSTWHIQKGDSAWLCQNLWDHYAFTRDRRYLERYAYPVMREISEFWLDHLKPLPDGTLVAPAGRSPEHGPVDVDGVTYDQCLCWDLFANTIEAADALGVDAALRDELAEKRDRLLGPRVGRWGQLQEWMEDIDDPACDHRHLSHLICVHPGRQVHPLTTPDLAAAALVSLTARRDHGRQHPAWSRVWKACLFARLLDAEAAYAELAGIFPGHVLGNLWTVHPPFQIDANFGYAAAVNEMLLQSHLRAGEPTGEDAGRRPYVLHLLPAVPAAWADGAVTGLRARGGFEVDMRWQNGRLSEATIRNITAAAAACVLRCGDQTVSLRLAAGEQRRLRELGDA